VIVANPTAAVNTTGHGLDQRDRQSITTDHSEGALDRGRAEKQRVEDAYHARWKAAAYSRAALEKKVAALLA
jgi:hypothetical protein